MKDKLDKYIKQNLNSPQQPPQDAWEFIQTRIPKEKEKKRIIPFWVRLSGIAAVLLLMVGFGYWLGTYNTSDIELNQGIAVNPSNNSTASESQTINNSNQENFENNVPNYIQSERNVLNSNDNSSQIHPAIFDRNKVYSQNYIQNNHNNNSNNETHDLNFNSFVQNTQQTFGELIAENLSALNNSWNNLDVNLNPITSLTLPNINDANLSKNKNPELLLVLEDKPKEEKKKKKKIDYDRFHISAFASPLAFNTFVGNSMLADEMSQYNTENNVTLAYGVKAAYSVSPTLKIRTGVSMVGLEQITKNVPLEVQVAGANSLLSVDKINNINYGGNVRIDNNPMAASLLGTELTQQKSGYGNMQQQTSYVEIPLEAELSLFQTNSIGISATGGGSTWVLSKNKIYVHTDDYTQELGEANNLNNVTFSANAGLKFDMNLTENIKLNVEPNFRYLVNPVNNIEKYNPYTVGVNAGISVSLK
ncbi:hypothetical protein [Moheibacter sediminis]|uniref:Outer membrane protein beta-barrel domain-containing protein n=1 Tax=Moheibacter sediminis TaxID=1434700 RepID=A0A1W2AKG3_9FLAO|nr:hypothetical protein [Moheibacter sediminis]SMC61143.1 hypothetical protein SAMN06296427_104246 [Moheibacter sediminis]